MEITTQANEKRREKREKRKEKRGNIEERKYRREKRKKKEEKRKSRRWPYSAKPRYRVVVTREALLYRSGPLLTTLYKKCESESIIILMFFFTTYIRSR